ncbi:MAG: tetratricopeptide repeat protein, partial [Acidobacteria bacterium]|nr:tetratricopeptide repeat protein [Acidobacteriota bacterium]
MIRDHLWTGVGLGNFTFAFVPYRAAVIYQNPGVRIEHPHNELLNTWAELGPLGVLVLLWLVVRVLKLGWGLVIRRQDQRGILAGVLGGLAASAVYANLFYVGHLPASAMNIVILLGMLHGMDRERDRPERAKPMRLALLVPGLLIALVLGVEYFVRPLAGEVHYWLAERLVVEKRMEAGLDRLERSLQWDPHSYGARYRRAAILSSMGRYKETIREAEMAIRIHPKMEIAYGIMASAYLNLGEKAKAEGIFRQALALNVNYPHALNNLGVIAAQDGRIAEAKAMFLRAQEILGRTQMSPYANLGNLYEMTGRTREALKMYETA